MKRNDKQRLFEVMGRLDKTFKPKLNEGFEEIEATDDVALPSATGEEAPVEEKSPEEKLQELTAKVDELYAMLHGETEEEVPAEETGEEAPESLQEWNFDKKKGEKKDEEKKEGEEGEEKEEGEKEEKKELDEAKPKVPVAAIAKVGK
jgi:hypothetical protein